MNDAPIAGLQTMWLAAYGPPNIQHPAALAIRVLEQVTDGPTRLGRQILKVY
jgi:hypothetical protein